MNNEWRQRLHLAASWNFQGQQPTSPQDRLVFAIVGLGVKVFWANCPTLNFTPLRIHLLSWTTNSPDYFAWVAHVFLNRMRDSELVWQLFPSGVRWFVIEQQYSTVQIGEMWTWFLLLLTYRPAIVSDPKFFPVPWYGMYQQERVHRCHRYDRSTKIGENSVRGHPVAFSVANTLCSYAEFATAMGHAYGYWTGVQWAEKWVDKSPTLPTHLPPTRSA